VGEPTAGAEPDYEQIVLDVADGVATLTLNRPDRLNAFTGRMGAEIIDAFDRTDADDRVRAVVVSARAPTCPAAAPPSTTPTTLRAATAAAWCRCGSTPRSSR
jgi:1,4-dihydroxy-2-naphthoyl-CoA synthase